MFRSAAVLLCLCTAQALDVSFGDNFLTYAVHHKGSLLFEASEGIAVHVDGKWYSQKDGSLKLTSSKEFDGDDTTFGAFTGQRLSFTAGDTPFVAEVSNFKDEKNVKFQVFFPNGAEGTVLENGHQDALTNFPAFTTVNFEDARTWEGSFMQARKSRGQGATGGPTVFYNASDLSSVVIGSAINNFKASTAGAGKTFNNITAWAPGITGTVKSIPANYNQSFLLHANSGLTQTIGSWGKALRDMHNAHKVKDVTLTNIGYQTDNGAYYVFCRGNCSDTLLKVKESLDAAGVPIGYLSFQGSGASASHGGGAPWCVSQWGPDQGLGGNYPMPLKDFASAMDVPMQYYAPYFCPENVYFGNGSQWEGVQSDVNQTGCGSYAFWDVTPKQSKDFYKWFFAKGVAVGMKSFEPDFMNQNYNCMPAFTESVDASPMWMEGMAGAALDMGLTVQWCYAAPTDVMQALHYPAVTNFRVSNDFCYGQSWNVGESSLLAWAMGAAPSKDTLWTSDNGGFAVPGCKFGPDHETPAAELHVVIALMTTGPVGISDGLNMTNATLTKRTITADGTLLKPSKPITSIDSELTAHNGPAGHVYSTWSGVDTAVWAWSFVSFMLSKEFAVAKADFYPAVAAQAVYHRTFNQALCTNGGPMSECVVEASTEGAIFTAPMSNQQNVTGGTNLAPEVTTVYPVSGSVVLLGELSKYVPLSPNRFDVAADGASATVTGTKGEEVVVTAIDVSTKKAMVKTVTIPDTGSAHVSFP